MQGKETQGKENLGNDLEENEASIGTEEAVRKEFFHCSTCGHHSLADRKAFDVHNLGVKTWCKICKKSREVKDWRCRCKVPWHQCSAHRTSPQAMRRAQCQGQKKPRLEGQQRGVKRTLEEAEDGIGKRREAKAEVVKEVSFSEKEAKAICTDANKAFAERLLNGRFKHLTRG